eukprot:TRINITY_DN3750_c0_g1_i1.p2 TRINITY_DN3750_c0_g1~~TRINITY_DN3750_c0_g1_i1.p2  ORF type:complete len:215 (+),score=68.66 TRINITY_DN3750_c0_g1_i1:81-725(+)
MASAGGAGSPEPVFGTPPCGRQSRDWSPLASPELRFGSEARVTPLPPSAIDAADLLTRHEQLLVAMGEGQREWNAACRGACVEFGRDGAGVAAWLTHLAAQAQHQQGLMRLHKLLLSSCYDTLRRQDAQVAALTPDALERLKLAVRTATAAVEYEGGDTQELRDRVAELEAENARLQGTLREHEATAEQCAAAFAQYDLMNQALMAKAKRGEMP